MKGLATATALTMLLAACGAGDSTEEPTQDTDEETGATTTSVVASDSGSETSTTREEEASARVPQPLLEAIDAYLGAHVSNDIAGMAEASVGPAEDYAGYLSALDEVGVRLSDKELLSAEPGTISEDDGADVVVEGSWTVAYGPQSESTFSSFTLSQEGDEYLVSDFVSAGTPMSAKVAEADSEPVSTADISVEPRYLFWSGEGETMNVVVRVVNNRDSSVGVDGLYTTFTSEASGKPYTVGQLQGGEAIRPGEEVLAGMAFGDVMDASGGGMLAIELVETPSLEKWQLEVELPAVSP